MVREIRDALVACLLTFTLCSIAYPGAVWAIGRVAFRDQANGSLLPNRDRGWVGSSLIAQPFRATEYFHSRPSAVDYKADATGGSNLSPTNPALRKTVQERAQSHGATAEQPVPADLVTASGSGMDPHISPGAAIFQAKRVARARKADERAVLALIDRFTERSGALIGAPPRVNVLQINLALDDAFPRQR